MLALTVSIFLFLPYQNSSAQDYAPYIGLHVMGDTISIDTAAVLDIRLYRSIRNYNQTSDELLSSKISLIEALEKQVSISDSLSATLRSQVFMVQSAVIRKDSVIGALSGSFTDLEALNRQSLFMLEESLNKKKPFYSDPWFWIGSGLGFVVATVLVAN